MCKSGRVQLNCLRKFAERGFLPLGKPRDSSATQNIARASDCYSLDRLSRKKASEVMLLFSKHKAALGLVTLLSLSSTSMAFAAPSENIGRMVIRDIPASADGSMNPDGLGSFQQSKNDIGRLKISEDLIDDIMRERMKKDSKEVTRLKQQLKNVVNAANDFDYEQALLIMEHLHAEHPESRALLKWLGVYQNWAGEYEDSLRNFQALLNSYPLKDSPSDYMAHYYIVDNRRHLGLDTTNDMQVLKALAEKENPDLYIGGIDSKTLAKALTSYQEFMLTTNNGTQGFTPTDSKVLDNLWKQIPKAKQLHLDNFYGYNIDELTPVYSTFYRRKDMADEYANRQEKRKEHLAAAEIKKKDKAQGTPAEVSAAPKDSPDSVAAQDSN